MKYGVYIFEGIDHVGKTSIVKGVQDVLQNELGIVCKVYSFPGKEKRTLGGLVYDIHHNWEKYFDSDINEVSKQLLHVAAHIENIYKVLLPCMGKKEIILLDRCWWSTYAYGQAQGISEYVIKKVIDNEMVFWNKLDVVKYYLITRSNIVFDYPIETAKKIQQIYEMLVEENDAKVVVNDGSLSEVVQKVVGEIVN